MILDGGLDSFTEEVMAGKLGVSARHLRRLFKEHLGVTPNELTRSTRAHFARRLLDDTDLTITEIAFAAGFGSLRQMNRVMRETFRATPSELRTKRRKSDRLVADGGLPLRIPFEGAFDWAAMIDYYEPRAIPGVERVADGQYVRTAAIDGDPGVLEVSLLDPQHLLVIAHLPHWESLIHIARRAAGTFGLNKPTEIAREHLAQDALVGPLVKRNPGVRVPGAWDPFEIGIRAILEREFSVSETSEIMGRLARECGTFVPGLRQLGLTHVFPQPREVATSHADELGLPVTARTAITALSQAMSKGNLRLESSADMDDLITALAAIDGFDITTAQSVAFRLGYRDSLPLGELQRITTDTTDLLKRSESWRPWRSLAAAYLLMAPPRQQSAMLFA
jgi:AraC family transcriptional regulator of adaptative response / DNA-3-methyladenine glycosylase II